MHTGIPELDKDLSDEFTRWWAEKLRERGVETYGFSTIPRWDEKYGEWYFLLLVFTGEPDKKKVKYQETYLDIEFRKRHDHHRFDMFACELLHAPFWINHQADFKEE